MRRLIVLMLLPLATCALNGCRKGATAVEEEAGTPTDPVPVHVVQAELTTLRPCIDLVGTLVALPECTTSVSPQVGGWIEKIAVVEGTPVHKGDALVFLDARAASVDVARAKAAVAEKEATLARLKRGYLPQEIEMAREDVRKAKETADSLRAEVAALEPLRKRKEIAELQYQKAGSSLREAEANQAAVAAKVKLLEAGTPKEEIAEAEARLSIAHADRAAAELNLQLCKITSPINGTVTQLTARQGMFVERSTPLLTIMDLSRVFMQVRIPSAQMGQVAAGARVDVRVNADRDQVFHGVVTRISGQADPTTGDVDAFVALANDKRSLRPGLSCRGRLWLPEMKRVLAVPVAAVADRAGVPVVTVIRENKAHETEISVGIHTQDRLQVTGGLSAGDWVASKGGYGLPDDCPVRVVTEASPSSSPNDSSPARQ